MMFVLFYAISICEYCQYIALSNAGSFVWLTRIMVEGRNDTSIVEVLESLTQPIAQNPQNNQNA